MKSQKQSLKKTPADAPHHCFATSPCASLLPSGAEGLRLGQLPVSGFRFQDEPWEDQCKRKLWSTLFGVFTAMLCACFRSLLGSMVATKCRMTSFNLLSAKVLGPWGCPFIPTRSKSQLHYN